MGEPPVAAPWEVHLFAKTPAEGRVKTRLTRGKSGLSPAQAMQVHAACVRDILERDAWRAARRVAWVLGEADHALWDGAARLGWEIRAQPASGDLGSRLRHAVTFARAPMLVIGADSPDIPTAFLEEAVRALHRADVVVGPSFDGGYYLIGVAASQDAVFADGIRWGSEFVLAETLALASAARLRVELLPFWHDLDEVADLRRLRVCSGRAVGGAWPHRPERTLRLLESLGIDCNGDQV